MAGGTGEGDVEGGVGGGESGCRGAVGVLWEECEVWEREDVGWGSGGGVVSEEGRRWWVGGMEVGMGIGLGMGMGIGIRVGVE